MSRSELLVEADESAVVSRLWATIDKLAAEAIEEHGAFRVGLSGGSLVKLLATGASSSTTDWSKWQLFFCDERYVPADDEDSNYGQFKKIFIGQTKLKENQFITIDANLSLEQCAMDYQTKILEAFNITNKTVPQFDLLLLGMGPDGHTCSLFPGHRLLDVDDVLIAPIDDSPKPPPKRVTMTYALINNARVSLFAMAGEGKAEMVKRILVDGEQLPAGRVRPSAAGGKLIWILDQAAAKLCH